MIERSKWMLAVATIVLLVGIGALDRYSGPRLEFGVVYLAPVLIAATINRRIGIAIALVSALLAGAVDYSLSIYEQDAWLYLWDLATHTVIFVMAAYLHSGLVAARRAERTLAMTDPLTGLMNLRAFCERAELELARLQRNGQPLTIVYLDIDRFKAVNDAEGHRAGDQLLRDVAATLRHRLRTTDALARLGGDEFALLSPETNQDAAHDLVIALKASLDLEMARAKWPVTFSIGVLTCLRAPESYQSAMQSADALMYRAKGRGKNAVESALFPD